MAKFWNNKRIRKFLKQKKMTWFVLIVLVTVNVSVPVVGLYGFYYLDNSSVVFDYLLFLPLLQIIWLWQIFAIMGVDVIGRGGNELGANPNTFGWILLGLAVFMTLLFHYIIASKISHLYYKAKKLHGRRWWIVMLRQLVQGDERAEHTGRR